VLNRVETHAGGTDNPWETKETRTKERLNISLRRGSKKPFDGPNTTKNSKVLNSLKLGKDRVKRNPEAPQARRDPHALTETTLQGVKWGRPSRRQGLKLRGAREAKDLSPFGQNLGKGQRGTKRETPTFSLVARPGSKRPVIGTLKPPEPTRTLASKNRDDSFMGNEPLAGAIVKTKKTSAMTLDVDPGDFPGGKMFLH